MKSQDLNLLFVFNAIMTENSISRAAESLDMTQPAVSNAVSKMRNKWSDPLFVKKGRGIQPTSYATNLWKQIKQPMEDLSQALSVDNFDPFTSKRKFRISLSDMLVDLTWTKLACRLQRFAPSVDLYAVPYTLQGSTDLLREAKADITVGAGTVEDSSIRSAWLFDSYAACLMRKDHPLAKPELSLDEFVNAKHLLVSLSGEANGFVDEALSKLGLQRRIAMTVNHFSTVPQLLAETDLITVIPRIALSDSRYRQMLHIAEPPIRLEPRTMYLSWHARHDNDPAMTWVREQIIEVAKNEWSNCYDCAETEEKHRRGATLRVV